MVKTDDCITTMSPRWSTVLSRTHAVPTHQDAISSAFDPTSPLSRPAYARIAQLGAENVRYLHWTAVGGPIPEAVEGNWDSAACDTYVSSFMAAPNAETAVVNFNWPSWLHVRNSSENGLRAGSFHKLRVRTALRLFVTPPLLSPFFLLLFLCQTMFKTRYYSNVFCLVHTLH